MAQAAVNLEQFLSAHKVGAAGRKLDPGICAGCQSRYAGNNQPQRDFHVASILS
jgi:hypothetical protein